MSCETPPGTTGGVSFFPAGASRSINSVTTLSTDRDTLGHPYQVQNLLTPLYARPRLVWFYSDACRWMGLPRSLPNSARACYSIAVSGRSPQMRSIKNLTVGHSQLTDVLIPVHRQDCVSLSVLTALRGKLPKKKSKLQSLYHKRSRPVKTQFGKTSQCYGVTFHCGFYFQNRFAGFCPLAGKTSTNCPQNSPDHNEYIYVFPCLVS